MTFKYDLNGGVKKGMESCSGDYTPGGGGGGWYCQIWAIYVCAAVKGMVFNQCTLG